MRLVTEIWRPICGGFRRRDPGLRHPQGRSSAGAVIVKLATLDGQARAFVRRWDMATDTRRWQVLAEGAEAAVDAILSREGARDPDLWLIEVEDRAGRTLLEEEGLSEG